MDTPNSERGSSLIGVVLIIIALGVLTLVFRAESFKSSVGSFNVYTFFEYIGFDIKPDDEEVPIDEFPVSPYEHIIDISFVSLGSGNEAGRHIILSHRGGEDFVNLTDWTMRGANADVRIPQARDLNTAEGVGGDIFLNEGNTLTLFTGEGLRREDRRIGTEAWEVWFETDFMGFPHDTLILFDAEGKKVDTFTY